MVENIKSSVKLVIDTSTFFSAIYNRHGNEAELFKLADKGKFSIYIVDYVLEEIQNIFQRKNLDFTLVLELIDTYHNVEILKLSNLTPYEIQLARDLISDPEDRPVFIFALRMINEHNEAYFISGDNIFYQEDVKQILKGRVIRTRDLINIIQVPSPGSRVLSPVS